MLCERDYGTPLPDSQTMTSITELLRRVGFNEDVWPSIRVLLWRSLLLGTTLYLALADDPIRNLRYNAIAFIAAYIWSYYDSVLTARRWSISWAEALFLHLFTVQVSNLLIMIFGSPLVPAN